LENISATQPRFILTRLPRRSRLREGAAKNPCQLWHWGEITRQVTLSLGSEKMIVTRQEVGELET